MGAVITQLSRELQQRQREVRYGMAKGAIVGAWLGVVALLLLLWRRPVLLAFVLAVVLDLLLIGTGLVLPIILGALLAALILADVVTTDGARVVDVRRRIAVRRRRLALQRGWKSTTSDLGLTSTYKRRGSDVIVYPKLIEIEDRK